MNARKAKALRRKVYGEQSLRQERTYSREAWNSKGQLLNHPDSLRAKYQQLKKGGQANV